MPELIHGFHVFDHGGDRVEVKKGKESWFFEIDGEIELIRYDNPENEDLYPDEEEIKEKKDIVRESSVVK